MDKGCNLTSFGCKSECSNVFLVVITNVTFCLDRLRKSHKRLRNDSLSPESRTPSALSRTNVTWLWICLLQSLSHCPGFSGTCVLTEPHMLIILMATSFKVDFVCKLQNSTVPSFSEISNSWATRLATVVFPNPGPPVTRTTGMSPPSAIFVTRSISWLRPNTFCFSIMSGKQLRGLKLDEWILSCSCILFHSLASSSKCRLVSWSMGSFFSASISSTCPFCRT